MEAFLRLANEQESLGIKICHLTEQIRKEPIARRTKKFIEEKGTLLQQYWDEFVNRHAKLGQQNITDHSYFKKDYYAQVAKDYNKAVNMLANYEKALLQQDFQTTPTTICSGHGIPERSASNNEAPSTLTAPTTTKTDTQPTTFLTTTASRTTEVTNPATTASGNIKLHNITLPISEFNSEQQQLRIKRQRLKMESFYRTRDDITYRENEVLPKSYYEYKKWSLSEQFNKICELHEEIVLNESSFECEYFANSEYEVLESAFHDAMTLLHQKEGEIDNVQPKSEVIRRLPKIQIPYFEGEYKLWTSFHDIFKKVIHDNKQLSEVEKMQYIKSYVKGEAAKLIRHLEISGANYDTAWNLLNERYNNKRILLHSQLDTLFNLPTCNSESTVLIKQLHDTTRECLHAIDNLGVDTSSWGPIIVFLLLKKLDKDTRKWYEQSLADPRKIPDLSEFLKALEIRFQSLENLKDHKKQNENFKPSYRFEAKSKSETKTYSALKLECKYCKEAHSIYRCKKFQDLNVNERSSFVKSNKLCNNCLNNDEKIKCYCTRRCEKCKKNHHTLLHETTASYNATTGIDMSTAANTVATYNAKIMKGIILATALVKVQTATGSFELLRALIDPGSQASFITEQAAQTLQLPKKRSCTEVTGVGATGSSISKSKLQLTIAPRFPSVFSITVEALILPNLTKLLPSNKINLEVSVGSSNIMLADPTYDTPGPIDLILGADIYGEILQEGLRHPMKGIVAQKTELGWILTGNCDQNKQHQVVISLLSLVDINEQLTKFWEIEDVPKEKLTKSNDMDICEEHFISTHKRESNGTYTVALPLKENVKELGDSRKLAIARLLQLEKRFERDEELKQEYIKFMKEYLNLGHMKEINPNKKPAAVFYLPHQAVIKKDSTTTKLRVVFDASAKSSTKLSLNEVMHAGPKLQQNLADILMRWRKHKYVLKADIEKMYRMVKIKEEHQDLQRIVWRFAKNDPIKEYNLTTITYGTTAAPYLAVKVLQQLATDERINYPAAADTVIKDFYVDDLMTGAGSIDEAEKLVKDLCNLLKAGGFNLRKWASNNEGIIKTIPAELKETINDSIEINDGNTIKTLGILWTPQTDCFQIKVSTSSKDELVTKRTMLSDIAKLFDPLGWTSPVIITAKMMLQELWANNSEWDKQLPSSLLQKWKTYKAELPLLQNIKIERWLRCDTANEVLEIHGFCDASERAYGAVIYVKVINGKGQVHTSLLTAKTRVAPLKKKTTLPRLELCGAALLAQLIHQVKQAMEWDDNIKTYTWSDSSITLAWIKGGAAKWKTFVANKVKQILSVTSSTWWNHVPSKQNPADFASRGVQPSQLQRLHLWWNGPEWMKESQENWPSGQKTYNTEEEIRPKEVFHIKAQRQEDFGYVLNRFSHIFKLLRVICYCVKFIKACKKETVEINITAREINNALKIIMRLVQKEAFDGLQSKELRSLNPFYDTDGLLRVGGRIHKADIPYMQKHPIILPSKHHVTNLIIDEAHQNTLHGTKNSTLALIRRKYWIIRGKDTVKRRLNKCLTCARYNAEKTQQLMGELPAPRVTPSKPFKHTGLDYAGPIQIRCSKGRGQKSYKGYIVIFVCLATKALHIELVSDLSSEAFIAAFRRFIARRGACTDLYSDNATTFTGANKTLDRETNIAIQKNQNSLSEIALLGTQWHFIPPAAPHFGGIWEAGVKAIKHHLRRIVGNSTLTFEEMITLLYQIEAVLNSRPLCQLTEDPEDMNFLTPAHFLIGEATVSPADPIDLDKHILPLQRWKLIQKMRNDFWKVWSKDYLNRLQQRSKWKMQSKNLKVGQLVLIKDEQLNPINWPIGRIIATHPGDDGLVRVVSVKCRGNAIFKRPITKVCSLPIEAENEEKKENSKDLELENITSVNSTTIEAKNEPWRKKKAGASSDTLIKSQQFKPFCRSCPLQSIKTILALLLFFTIFIKSSKCSYNITYPPPGLYLEHLGNTQIKRGTLRVEVSFPLYMLHEDVLRLNSTVANMTSLCARALQVSDETHCDQLIQHLEINKEEILRNIQTLEQQLATKRSRRGVLGKLLEFVFGVNDEVYTELDALDKNQKHLLQTINHQTSIMLSTLATANDTEMKVARKLNEFTTKLNKAIQNINTMQQAWFTAIDDNKVNIHLLSTYEAAKNYLELVSHKYNKLINAYFQRANLLDFVAPSALLAIFNKTEERLPFGLGVLRHMNIKVETVFTNDEIKIYGFYHIAELSHYTLIRCTAIPRKLSRAVYQAPDLAEPVIAINYNLQNYFALHDAEWQRCSITTNNTYLCMPTVIRNIENNPNCIIDEIYSRHEGVKCPLRNFTVDRVAWKHLCMKNTWLFIANSPISAALLCNGIRTDILLNGTGIIKISSECSIKTKYNILKPEIAEEVTVISSYSKPMEFNVNTTALPRLQHLNQTNLEPVLKVTDQIFQVPQQGEVHLIYEITKMRRTAKIHTGLIIALIASIVVGYTVRLVYHRCKGQSLDDNTNTNDCTNSHSFELHPSADGGRQNVDQST